MRARTSETRLALARLATEEQVARIPRAQWLPSVGVTAQLFGASANNTTGTYVYAPFVDVPRIGGTSVTNSGSMQPYPTTFVGGGLNQEVFDFGRIAAQAAAATMRSWTSKGNVPPPNASPWKPAWRRRISPFMQQSRFFVLRPQYGALQVHRDLARAGVGAGLRSPIEATRAEADFARFRIGWERARASVTVAENLLAATVGIPDPILEVPDAAPAVRDMPSMAQALQDIASRDPWILEAQARIRAQEQATKAIATELRPSVALTSSFSLRAGGAPPSNAGPAANGGGWAPDVPIGILV